MNQSLDMNPTFIFVDGSYYCFHRYFALLQWWKNAFPEEPLENPFLNLTFVDKFNKTFVDNLQQISKKLKIPKTIHPILIVGKDCKDVNNFSEKHVIKNVKKYKQEFITNRIAKPISYD